MLIYKCSFILTLFVCKSLQQSIQNGFCQYVNTIRNFDINSIMGTWYQIERIPNSFELYDCPVLDLNITRQFTPNIVLGTYTLTETAPNNTLTSSTGIFNHYGAGQFHPESSPGSVVTVVATDYTSYALVHDCINNIQENTKYVFAWKLSRTKTLNETQNTIINNAISTVEELRNVTWRTTVQDCNGSESIVTSISLLFTAVLVTLRS